MTQQSTTPSSGTGPASGNGPASSGPSSSRGLWRVVAAREVSTQLRSKAFRATAALLLVGVIAMVVLLTALSGRDQQRTVAVVDPAATSVVDAAAGIASGLDDHVRLQARTYPDVRAAEQAVRDGDVDAALLASGTGTGYDVVGDDDVDATVGQSLAAAVSTRVTGSNAEREGVDLQALTEGTQVTQRLLDPDAADNGLRSVASFVFVILFYITALSFGMVIASSVTQEKESRVVEILAAAVPIRTLLWGKIAGTSVLAIGQTLLLAAAGVVGLAVTGNTHALTVLGPAIVWYVVFFVLGFVTLASLWSVAGSLAGRQQDLQGTTAPLQILLFAPYIIALTAGEGVRTVVSMLPVVSTMLMPSRLAEGDVPLWQLVVAVLATLVAAVAFVRVGARVYEETLLRTGRRIGFRGALRTRPGSAGPVAL